MHKMSEQTVKCPKHDKGAGPCYCDPANKVLENVKPCPKHNRGVGPCICGRSPKKELIWEDVDENIFRAKVFGGWLVTYVDNVHISFNKDMGLQEGYEWRTSLVFIPDIKHEWDLYPKE